MYCLSAAWLNTAENRKLDAFQAKCLRKIAGVKPSWISRVSNQTVRESLKCDPLSSLLLQQQLLYFGNLARRPNDVMRNSVFQPSSIQIRSLPGPRPRGRPRTTWATAVYETSLNIAGGQQALEAAWANTDDAKNNWQAMVAEHCRHT